MTTKEAQKKVCPFSILQKGLTSQIFKGAGQSHIARIDGALLKTECIPFHCMAWIGDEHEGYCGMIPGQEKRE